MGVTQSRAMRRSLLLVAVLAVALTGCAHAESANIGGTGKATAKQAPAPPPMTAEELKFPKAPGGDAPPEEHLPPLFPLGPKTLGIVVAAVGLMVAAGGGIGGGGVLVPVYIMVCMFPAKLAIPLSNITIFGGSIANCFLNIQKRHPYTDRPLVDFDLVNIMEPLTIAGAIVGSILNKMLPGWLVTLMLVIVLGATGLKTFKSGCKAWAKETDAKKGESGENVALKDQDEEKTYGTKTKDPLEAKMEKDQEPEYQALLAEEAHWLPCHKIMLLVICFIGTVTFGLIRGPMECGSTMYMVLMFAPLPWVLAISFYQRKLLMDMHEKKERLNYYEKHPVPGDVHWDESATVKYPLICSIAGMCAGMFGIGGGIVKGPLMLEMGVDPQVSAGTAAFMIFFTAGSASVSYALFGLLQLDYAIFFAVFGLIFTFLGQKLSENVIKRLGRPSFVIFLIAAIVTASTVLMGIEGVINEHENIKHHIVEHLGLCAGAGRTE